MALIPAKTDRNMKDSFILTNSTAKVLKYGQMAPATQVITMKAKSTVEDDLLGWTAAHMRENLFLTILKAKVSIDGLMVAYTLGNGSIIRWMGLALSVGLTGDDTWVIISSTKKRASVLSNGQI